MTRWRAASLLIRLTLPLTASGLTLCSAAGADEAADTAAARALGTDGVMLADAGKCTQAIEKLSRAEKLRHAPTTAARLGECEIEVGKIVQGTERLQRLVREPALPGAPAVFATAIQRGRGVLEKALPRIAMLRISVEAPPGTKYVVMVDGEPLPDALIDNDRPTNPGAHELQVTAEGFRTTAAEASLGEGETKGVVLELRPDPTARSPAPTTITMWHDAPPSSGSPYKGPAVAFLTVGVLGVGTGAVAGTVVATKASSLSASCGPNKMCPQDRQSELSSARTWATASTVSFVVGGAGLASGLLLLLAERSPPAPSTGIRVRPVLGAAYAGFDGSF